MQTPQSQSRISHLHNRLLKITFPAENIVTEDTFRINQGDSKTQILWKIKHIDCRRIEEKLAANFDEALILKLGICRFPSDTDSPTELVPQGLVEDLKSIFQVVSSQDLKVNINVTYRDTYTQISKANIMHTMRRGVLFTLHNSRFEKDVKVPKKYKRRIEITTEPY